MAASAQTQINERIEAALALVRAKVPQAERGAVETFVTLMYEQVDPEDLAQRSVDDLYGAALSLWRFAHKRSTGTGVGATARVRVLNPSVAEHGWTSRHTVIEIVNDDMPFLVDSETMEINRQGLTLHLIIHPVMAVERHADGTLKSVRRRTAADKAGLESMMYIEVDRVVDAAARAQLAAGIERVLGDVRATVEDWPQMLARLRGVIDELQRAPTSVPAEDAAEARAFLEWLADGNLLLLGYRQHDLVDSADGDALRLVEGSGLGVLREAGSGATSGSFAALPAQARAMARAAVPVAIVTKANARSTVHRPGYTDYVGIKRYDAAGAVIGEHRFLGLLTSSAYAERAADTPLVRGKLAEVIRRAGLAPTSHLGKALVHVLETYPRDELFMIDVDELHETALGILHLGERQRLRLFIRRDPFERFVSCLIFVPRDAYSTEMRHRFIGILTRAFNGTGADFDVLLSDTILARIHITVRTTPGEIPAYDRREVEARLAVAARRWEDELRDALVDDAGEAEGMQLAKRFVNAFPASYREYVAARAAVPDVRKMQSLARAGELALGLYRAPEAPEGRLGFRLYHVGSPVVLSDSLPMLERMGARVMAENPFKVNPDGGPPIWIHDIEMQVAAADEMDLDTLAPLFENAFAAVFHGRVDNDEFNRLVLAAGLAAEDVVILRAYAKYLRQIGFALSQSFIESTLAAHPRIARMLVHLFRLRFDPTGADDEAAARQTEAIEQALEKVANLSEDRVLRQYLGLVQSTLRTNFWRTGVGASGAAGPRRTFLSFKFDSAAVPGLPEPKPMFEIFVYSPRFEGIHLRAGKVARGGLRWSDRPEDFRTEVLGLVKAQVVKNTVIVPVGSKGGFVLKKAPPAGPTQADRDALMKEGIACYQDYLRGLLDLTDNRVGDAVVPPPLVRRIDGDDPYLVVAADKGTATFSDYANAVSAEYGHWLGDAFASGGSAGYDHKKMGITARGAWESVKRHFREIGIDTQTTDFTCAGIGDMSGDVFGNGMLLSRRIRLVAAFDHRHIFLDPDPDAATSFDERKRLFDLPRSSWADYDAELISAGGGVWPRSAKTVPVSPQAAARLGIGPGQLAPTELVSAILKAPVDLLYNGGIGTYVKASTESHAQVGDRANDALRVDGRMLRCKVVAEGGNLGLTQRGRIEAAHNGVRLYTDAIDNSAGVDTSDHEVNLKILFGLAIADGELTEKQRNALLVDMTEDVAAQVLRDNYFQTQIVSLTRRVGAQVLEQQARFIRFLEKGGRLARAIEFLPSDGELASRRAQQQGMTNPEIAVLLAYSKMWLYDEALASNLPEDPWIGTALARYFPARLRDRFGATIERHPLKREIVCTHVINSMVNRVGVTFVHRLIEASGAKCAQIVRAYLLARESFGHVPLWTQIEALDNRVPDEVQAQMLTALDHLTLRATRWFLRSRRLADPMAATITRAQPGVAALFDRLLSGAHAAVRDRILAAAQPWIDAGVPPALAQRVAAADPLVAALDVTELAESTARPLERVADVLVAVGERLDMPHLQRMIDALPAENYWHGMAKTSLTDDLADLQRTLAGEALQFADSDDTQASITGWAASEHGALERAQRLLHELAEAPSADLAMLSVALRELRSLA